MYTQMVAKRTDTYIIQVYSQDSAEHMYVRNTNACIVFGQVFIYIYIDHRYDYDINCVTQARQHLPGN